MFDLQRQATGNRRRRSAWAWSLAAHIGVVALLGTMAATSVPDFAELKRTDFKTVGLSAPPTLPPVPRLTPPARALRKRVTERQRFHMSTPASTPQETRAAIAPTLEPTLAAAAPAPLDLAVPMIAEVATPQFVESSFDVPSAAPAKPTELKASLGSFGAVVKGQRASPQILTLAASGFGQALNSRSQMTTSLGKPAGFEIASAQEAVAPSKLIRTTGFGAAERKIGPTTDERHAQKPPHDSSVKILWKPVPQYTDEAREQRIEGEVVVLVRFLSAGVVETIRVVNGLGYGLDQHAVAAAEAVRFEPATQNNEPVDFVAHMRIRFELAY